jgi:16S rRNA (guanine966-N2)-methyltransferase
VEQDHLALDALEKNIAKLGGKDRCDVRKSSVLSMGSALKPADIVLMDPPYLSGAGSVALDKLGRFGWFAPSAWISVETSIKEDVEVKGFIVDNVRNVGKAKITLLRTDAS